MEISLNHVKRIKVILLGDTAVGKTSLIKAIRSQKFTQQYQSTIGMDFFSKSLNIDDNEIKIQFWDTAGQQRYRCIIPSYIKNTHIGIILFDVCNRKSFLNVKEWLQLFKDYSFPEAIAIIVGNKIDNHFRQVSIKQVVDFADNNNIKYYEISAKMGTNIANLEQQLKQIILNAEICKKMQIKSQILLPSKKNIDPQMKVKLNADLQNQSSRLCCFGN